MHQLMIFRINFLILIESNKNKVSLDLKSNKLTMALIDKQFTSILFVMITYELSNHFFLLPVKNHAHVQWQIKNLYNRRI